MEDSVESDVDDVIVDGQVCCAAVVVGEVERGWIEVFFRVGGPSCGAVGAADGGLAGDGVPCL